MKKRIFISVITIFLIIGACNKFENTGKKSNIEEENKKIEVVQGVGGMKDRKEIDKKYKWNLDDIYKSWDEWQVDFEKVSELMKDVPKYKGEIKNSSEKFVELTNLIEKISRKIDKIYLYPYMLKDLDSTDEIASVKMQEIEMLYAKFAVDIAWLDPEILEIPIETMKEWINKYPELKIREFPLMELYRLQEHLLDEGKEKLLSYYSQFMGSSSDIYAELSISDMKWNNVKFSNGEELAVTNGVYYQQIEIKKIEDWLLKLCITVIMIEKILLLQFIEL